MTCNIGLNTFPIKPRQKRLLHNFNLYMPSALPATPPPPPPPPESLILCCVAHLCEKFKSKSPSNRSHWCSHMISRKTAYIQQETPSIWTENITAHRRRVSKWHSEIISKLLVSVHRYTSQESWFFFTTIFAKCLKSLKCRNSYLAFC